MTRSAIIIARIRRRASNNANCFHEMFPLGKLKAEAATAGLANRYFWSKLIGIQTCSVQVSCIGNAFEMRPVLNHNLHCTLHSSHTIPTVSDKLCMIYTLARAITHISIFHWQGAQMLRSHIADYPPPPDPFTSSYATKFSTPNFPIVDHGQF